MYCHLPAVKPEDGFLQSFSIFLTRNSVVSNNIYITQRLTLCFEHESFFIIAFEDMPLTIILSGCGLA